ncbi:jg23386 [Pararge aegeria aegeria]|uniref:Jg23386 protein n=1 Tax=Pararge aegeria aegeria TaxID=348720 RepID=A0A8S4RLD7_9NEOP|nr:jg23386 [Pararge aegeria aegeria]
MDDEDGSRLNFAYYPLHYPLNSFVLLNTDIFEVTSIINSLKNTNSIGFDGISIKILKQNKETIASLLVHICNLSFNSGTFPNIFKKSIVTPVYKQGDKNIISNYRPISILPAMSKILERIINKQLVKYLESNNLLANNQYGFRKQRSATDAVFDLVDGVVRHIDDGEKCLAIFLDLAKAFDTVSIPILIQKLEQLGIRGLQLQLLKSYLSNRHQSVKIGNVISRALPINHGVPQGSILAPTLFLIYINELCKLNIANGKIMSFADDTVLMIWGRSWEVVFYSSSKRIQ